MTPDMTPLDALQKAIDHLGGASSLASAIGVASNAPSMWKTRENVPAEHCLLIERATGGVVTCEDLRPDVAWEVIRAEPAKA